MEIIMHKKKKKNSLPPCLIYNIRKPQTALKLISKQRKPLGCVKPQYRSFCKIAQKIEQNRITANPYAPFSTILASFSTAMIPLLHIEFQENHRERRERERERERAVRTRTRQKPPRTFSTDKKKNFWYPGKGLPVVFNTFLFASREFTQPVLRDHLVERLLCDNLGYCVIIISFCIISNSHNH